MRVDPGGRPGVLHGNRTYLLMNSDGQINEAHSISAASTIRARARAFLAQGRRPREYLSATDTEALMLSIVPKLEASFRRRTRHALAKVSTRTPEPKDHLMVMTLWRGDKDICGCGASGGSALIAGRARRLGLGILSSAIHRLFPATRLFEAGPRGEKEWLQFIGSIVSSCWAHERAPGKRCARAARWMPK